MNLYLAVVFLIRPHCCKPVSLIDLNSDKLLTIQLSKSERRRVVIVKRTNDKLNEPSAPIENLEDLLTPLKAERCLVFLTSYKLVDMLNIKTPTIQRRLKLMMEVNSFENRFVWSFKRSLLNISSSENCSSRKFYVSFNISMDTYIPFHCTTVLVSTYTSYTRPWNCEIEVNLFLPDFKRNIYPEINYPITTEFYNRVPLVPRLNIFIDTLHELQKTYFNEICLIVVHLEYSHTTFLKGVFMQAVLLRTKRKPDLFTILEIYTYSACECSSKINSTEWNGRYTKSDNFIQYYLVDGNAVGYEYTCETSWLECNDLNMMERMISNYANGEDDAKRRLILYAQAYILQ